MKRNYYRLMLGKQHIHAAECLAGGFVGTHFQVKEDLTDKLTDSWQAFNKLYIPIYQALVPTKTKIGAGLACGALWTVGKGILEGDRVLCPDGKGTYHVGEVLGTYYYAEGENLPHRRQVKWIGHIEASQMSEALKNSVGSIGTVCNISGYHDEIESLLSGAILPSLTPSDEAVEDPVAFALEKHLEDFLVANWEKTDLGKDFDIFAEDGEKVGQQYPTDTGPMDILAISKDKSTLLVVELKRGRASDVVVGQILRYMGYVTVVLAQEHQTVRGLIIAKDADLKMQRALTAAPNIDFYRYQIDFKLLKS